MQRESRVKDSTLENLVERAKEGNRESLEEVVRRIQDKIYCLALRMLYLPADAEDATQEILIKVITRLDNFEGKSGFYTWVFKVASNHLLNTRRRQIEKLDLSFERLEKSAGDLRCHPTRDDLNQAETNLLAREVKLMCTNAMLLALRREIRLAFIIGEIFGVNSQEGAEILDITPEAFRQRLARGRKEIRDFLAKRCSLVGSNNPCRCANNTAHLVSTKWLDPNNLLFATHPCKLQNLETKSHPMKALDEIGRITALFRSHPDYAAPEALVEIIKRLLDSGRFELFDSN